MNKIIYTFIFLLPLLLLSCTKEVVVKEPSKSKKENAFKNYLSSNVSSMGELTTKFEMYQNDLAMYIVNENFKPTYNLEQSSFCDEFDIPLPENAGTRVAKLTKGSYLTYFYSSSPQSLAGKSCWEVDNDLNVISLNDNARKIELCLFQSRCY